MSGELEDLIRREAERVVKKWGPGHRFGIVSQYNPVGHQVKVTFPDDLDENGDPQLSPWMPIVAPASSAGAGDVAAPLMGSQAMVLHFGWGADRFTFMLGTVRSSQDTVPTMPGGAASSGVPEGCRAIVHPSGQGMFLTQDGHVLVGMSNGTFLRLATEDFVLNKFNPHTHIYSPGGGTPVQSGPPNLTVPSTGDTTDLTAQLKGT